MRSGRRRSSALSQRSMAGGARKAADVSKNEPPQSESRSYADRVLSKVRGVYLNGATIMTAAAQ